MTITTCFALAAHALVLLARQAEEGATSEHIAESANTHAVRVRRVLAPLVRAGIVTSREGGQGRYLLARPPSEITLDEIFATLGEGPVLPRPARAPDVRCPVGPGMIAALQDVENDVDEAVRGALRRRTVAWLAARATSAKGTSTEMKSQRRAFIGVVLSLALSGPLAAQEGFVPAEDTIVLSLDEEVRLALGESEEIRLARFPSGPRTDGRERGEGAGSAADQRECRIHADVRVLIQHRQRLHPARLAPLPSGPRGARRLRHHGRPGRPGRPGLLRGNARWRVPG